MNEEVYVVLENSTLELVKTQNDKIAYWDKEDDAHSYISSRSTGGDAVLIFVDEDNEDLLEKYEE
jgi:hypothetical protein